MKREVKPFVVEVKRGKRRQSFLGQPDDDTATMSEATRRAELALFSGATADPVRAKALSGEPAGRILPSLIEPPAPPDPEPEDLQPRRRGRKPGSKNKPKVPAPDPGEISAEKSVTPVQPDLRSGVSRPLDVAEEADGTSPDEMRQVPGEPRRSRLRDRSRILARYVHGTSPGPGEGWMRRGRRTRQGGARTPRA